MARMFLVHRDGRAEPRSRHVDSRFMDILNHFPTVPAGSPTVPDLPPPSKRNVNTPTPPDLLTQMLSARREVDAFAWLDPLREQDPEYQKATPLRIAKTLGNIQKMALGAITIPVVFLRIKLSEYTIWLKSHAGLRLLDVVMAEEMLDWSQGLDWVAVAQVRAQLANAAGIPKTYMDKLASNEHLPEAWRRRRFIRDAALTMERFAKDLEHAISTSACEKSYPDGALPSEFKATDYGY